MDSAIIARVSALEGSSGPPIIGNYPAIATHHKPAIERYDGRILNHQICHRTPGSQVCKLRSHQRARAGYAFVNDQATTVGHELSFEGDGIIHWAFAADV